MSYVITILDILICVATLSIGAYYLYQNRDNRSWIRTSVLLLLGAMVIDSIYSVYTLSSTWGTRSVTILLLHAMIGVVCSVLAFRPDQCEYPAVHHFTNVDVRRCLARNDRPVHSAQIYETAMSRAI